MRILHVEDNDDNIDVLHNRLKRAGFTVMIARDDQEAVSVTRAIVTLGSASRWLAARRFVKRYNFACPKFSSCAAVPRYRRSE